MKKIAIYDPYLDTLGGGEKYITTAAEILSMDNQVDLLIGTHLRDKNKLKLKKDLEERFNLDLTKVNIIDAPIGPGSNLIHRNLFLKHYDLLISFTDGSVYYSTAKRNFLHIQSPIANPRLGNLWNKIKLNSWDLIIYNSKFTQKHAKDNWPLKGVIIYPPVDIENIKIAKKKKQILSVGRFFGFLKEKKHEVMIKAFKELVEDNKLIGWSLNLVGTMHEGDKEYVEELKKLAHGLPVNFYPNLSYLELLDMYGESSIYWHAMGYQESDPTKLEHFGITTVEAMAGGCVPVVINAGGQVEIVEEGVGFRWDSIDQLKSYTVKLIQDSKLLDKMSRKSIDSAKRFSKESFRESIKGLINE